MTKETMLYLLAGIVIGKFVLGAKNGSDCKCKK